MKHLKKELGTNHNFSTYNKLRKENKIDNSFENKFNNLSLEEIISLKLELASKAANGKVYGFKIWNNLDKLLKDSVIRTALSICQSKNEARHFLGLTVKEWKAILKEYNPDHYFQEERDNEGT